ncbi:MAG: glucose/mannose-6-phosphate isomerase [Frankiales bacterium]|nr:glucose/mannose-6-phosphate isomerase [Frankiales bacterium]
MSPQPLNATLLDDVEALEAADTGGMLLATATSAAQVREAATACADAGLARIAREGRPRAVVVLGSGTAALTGDLLAALAAAGSPTPVLVVRGPDLPAWVGAADLAIAVSTSGKAAETLAAADEAVRRGARLVTVSAEGSPLDLRGEQANAPHVVVPGGRPARASLWSMAVPVLLAADALGLISVPPAAIEATAEILVRYAERCRPSYESFLNPGKTFAIELADALPLVWGTPPVGGLAANRLAAQLTRNAKLPALPGVLPEVLHTVLGCFDGVFGSGLPSSRPSDPLEDLFRDRAQDADDEVEPKLKLVLLRDNREVPAIAARAEAAAILAQERGIAVTSLLAEGESPLERFASLVALGDYASVYLALLEGVDPSDDGAASELAARLLP